MTETPEQPNRLDRIESILATVATQQATNTQAIAGLTQEVRQLAVKIDDLTDNVKSLTNDVTRVFSHDFFDFFEEVYEGRRSQ